MSFIGKLFGSDTVIKKATEGIYNGVDSAFFTNQEKAGHFLNLLKAYEPFKLAQRLLMLVMTVPYVLVWITCAMLIVASAFFGNDCVVYPNVVTQCANPLSETAKTLGELNNETLGTPVALILAFYFGGGAVEGVVTKLKAKT